VLVSTHYMEEAEYCHRLILMNRGRLIAAGTPAVLRASMHEPIFEVETDDAPRAVEALSRLPASIDARCSARRVHVVVRDAGGRADVRRVPCARRAVRTGHARVAPSLEDVFVALVRREGGAVVG
jgi:ABC-2 type transport system ATP-binding protein